MSIAHIYICDSCKGRSKAGEWKLPRGWIEIEVDYTKQHLCLPCQTLNGIKPKKAWWKP